MQKNNASNQSLVKALKILTLYSRECKELRLTEISDALDIPTSTVYRLLRTLEAEGFIVQNSCNGKYRLGPASYILGTNVVDINHLVDIAHLYMAKLSIKYETTTHIAITQNGRVLCVEKIEFPINKLETPQRGVPNLLQLTSVGKCLLAFAEPRRQMILIKNLEWERVTKNSIMDLDTLTSELQIVCKLGYAVDKKESNKHIYCFGAPILGIDGFAYAAISMSMYSTQYPANAMDMISDIKECAAKISREMMLV